MEEVNIVSNSVKRTKEIGAETAEIFLKYYRQKKQSQLFILKGELGSGKTTFLQGFARKIGVKGKILSPTFILMRKFEIQKSSSKKNFFKNFYHLDCYRIENARELILLGVKKIFLSPYNVIAIEWPEKIVGILPDKQFLIEFEFIDKRKRLIKLPRLKKIKFL